MIRPIFRSLCAILYIFEEKGALGGTLGAPFSNVEKGAQGAPSEHLFHIFHEVFKKACGVRRVSARHILPANFVEDFRI